MAVFEYLELTNCHLIRVSHWFLALSIWGGNDSLFAVVCFEYTSTPLHWTIIYTTLLLDLFCFFGMFAKRFFVIYLLNVFFFH